MRRSRPQALSSLPRLAVAVGTAALVPLLLARLPPSRPAALAPLVPPGRPGEAQAAPVASASARPLGSGPVRPGAPAMQHLDARRTNRSPHLAPRVAPAIVWTFPMNGPLATAPVVVDGAVVAASLAGTVAALDLASGQVRWKADLEERIYGAPLVIEGTIFVGVDRGAFVALDARSGKVRWRLKVDGDADTAAAPTPSGGLVFTAGRTAYGVARDGTVRWRYKHRRKLFGAAAVGDDGVAYVGAQDGAVLALAPDGSLRWRASLGADADGAPAIGDDGAVYAGTDGGEVVALAPADGAVRWRAAVGGFVRGPLAVARDGAVLATTYGPAPALVVLDGSSGQTLWRFAVQGTGAREFGVHGSPVEDASGVLVFGAQDDTLYALAPDGSPRWRVRLGGDIDGAVALVDGWVLVGCGDGLLYALRDPG